MCSLRMTICSLRVTISVTEWQCVVWEWPWVLRNDNLYFENDNVYFSNFVHFGIPHTWCSTLPCLHQDDPDDVDSGEDYLPDSKHSDPELYNLVTRYQMHKCKRKLKYGNVFITRCRFGFPRQPCETAKLNSVSDSLKTRNRIYQLARSVGDQPLLLMLWKANIDIQFVAGSCPLCCY